MGTAGNNTISALKQATGIGDNRLSAHHPDGPGAKTRFGMFHINGFDTSGLDDRAVPTTIRVGDVFPLYMRPAGGHTQITDVNRGSAYVIEHSLVSGSSLVVDTGSQTRLSSIDYDVSIGDGELGIKLNIQAEAEGNTGIRAKWNDGGINSDVAGYDTWIYAPAINIAPAKLTITSAYVPATGPAGELHVNYTFEGGAPSYEVDIFRRYSTNGGSTWSSYSLVRQETRSSEGSFEWVDTSVYSSYDYQYRLDIVDVNNDSDSAATNAMSPA